MDLQIFTRNNNSKNKMFFGLSWTDLFFIGLFIFLAIVLVALSIAIMFKVYNKCTNPMFNSDVSRNMFE